MLTVGQARSCKRSYSVFSSCWERLFTGWLTSLMPDQQCQSTCDTSLFTGIHSTFLHFDGRFPYERGSASSPSVSSSTCSGEPLEISSTSFLWAGCSSCNPTSSVKTLKNQTDHWPQAAAWPLVLLWFQNFHCQSLLIVFKAKIRIHGFGFSIFDECVWLTPCEPFTFTCPPVMKIRWFASQNATYFRVLANQFDICAHYGANHYTPCTRERHRHIYQRAVPQLDCIVVL